MGISNLRCPVALVGQTNGNHDAVEIAGRASDLSADIIFMERPWCPNDRTPAGYRPAADGSAGARLSPKHGFGRLGTLAGFLDEIAGSSLAVFGVLAFAPLMGFIALAVRLESTGPIFLKEKRQGCGRREIEVFTFRTFHQDNGDHQPGRIATTRIGRFLRNSGLDKLPQLLSIARNGTPLSAYGFWLKGVLGEA